MCTVYKYKYIYMLLIYIYIAALVYTVVDLEGPNIEIVEGDDPRIC